jgi:hypothetical protein
MPKKKLTKAQVKKKLKQIHSLLFQLEMDKLGQMGSFVSMSVPKLLETSDRIKRAFIRL